MVDSPHLEGVPLLILANKQDVEVIESACFVRRVAHRLARYLQGSLSVHDIKVELNKSAAKLGRRDCKVKAVSAKQGCESLLAFTYACADLVPDSG